MHPSTASFYPHYSCHPSFLKWEHQQCTTFPGRLSPDAADPISAIQQLMLCRRTRQVHTSRLKGFLSSSLLIIFTHTHQKIPRCSDIPLQIKLHFLRDLAPSICGGPSCIAVCVRYDERRNLRNIQHLQAPRVWPGLLPCPGFRLPSASDVRVMSTTSWNSSAAKNRSDMSL